MYVCMYIYIYIYIIFFGVFLGERYLSSQNDRQVPRRCAATTNPHKKCADRYHNIYIYIYVYGDLTRFTNYTFNNKVESTKQTQKTNLTLLAIYSCVYN